MLTIQRPQCIYITYKTLTYNHGTMESKKDKALCEDDDIIQGDQQVGQAEL